MPGRPDRLVYSKWVKCVECGKEYRALTCRRYLYCGSKCRHRVAQRRFKQRRKEQTCPD